MIYIEAYLADEWIIKGHAEGELSRRYRPHEKRRIRDKQIVVQVENVGGIGAKGRI